MLVLIKQPSVAFYINRLFQRTNSVVTSQKYSVQSDIVGYRLQLVDIKYIDYLISKYSLFDGKGVIDPRFFSTPTNATEFDKRYKVSRVKFLLVPALDVPLVSFAGEQTFVSSSDYLVDNDTLVIRVYLDMNELSKSPLSKYLLESEYLKNASIMLAYSSGTIDSGLKSTITMNVKKDIKDNLSSGLFSWPLRIEKITN